jgi:hypothetical protein
MPSSAGRSSRIGSLADAGRYTRTPIPVPDPSPGADVLITVNTGTVVATSQMAPAELGITDSTIKIGGPYVVIRGRSATGGGVSASNPYAAYLYNRPWGYMASAGYTALETFLSNVASNSLRFDFLSVDGADYNQGIPSGYDPNVPGSRDPIPSDWPALDDWENGQRWYDWHQYFAATLSAHGLGSKPIVWEEFYRYPVKTIYANSATRDSYDAALCADFYTLRQCGGALQNALCSRYKRLRRHATAR